MKYRAIRGINFPDGQGGEVRLEPGDLVTADRMLPKHLAWFLEVGAIEEVPLFGSSPVQVVDGMEARLHGAESVVPLDKPEGEKE